jgi:hypothetical protein
MKSDYKTIAAYIKNNSLAMRRDAARALGYLLGRGDLDEVAELRAEIADGEPGDVVEETIREVLHGFSRERSYAEQKKEDKLAVLVLAAVTLFTDLDREPNLSEASKKSLDRLYRAAVDSGLYNEDYVKEFMEEKRILLETIEEYKARLSLLS